MKKHDIKTLLKELGGSSKVAATLGISRAAVSQWKEFPVDRAMQYSKKTEVPLWKVRPDVWEPPAGIVLEEDHCKNPTFTVVGTMADRPERIL